MRFVNDPQGRRLPVKLDTTTNGEFEPVALAAVHHRARRLAHEAVDVNARRLGMTRRSFLVSSCGAATALLAMNAAYGATARRGGYFDVPADAALELPVARSALDKREFVFDVQGHFVNPTGAWTRRLAPGAQPLKPLAESAGCDVASSSGLDYLRCIDADTFVKDVFLDSDTDVIVLSFVPSTRNGQPLTIEEAQATAGIVERMDGMHRVLLHGRVNPNQDGDLQDMDMLAERYPIAAWKTYTQWGPDGNGFFLDDDVGLRFIEKARALGIRNIAVHKGLPFGRASYRHSTCVDIGRVAKRFPDVNFLVYHSGFVPDQPEHAYDAARGEGIDALVTSLVANGVRPNSNVFAELGSTWRFLMRDPDSAAHALGKLLVHVGEDNVLWGTDSIWYGSPQDQIQAFRTFRIADELVAAHGYPRMTPALRAKVFGRNALRVYKLPADVVRAHVAQDRLARERADYRERADPSFVTYGPKTRREFRALRARGG